MITTRASVRSRAGDGVSREIVRCVGARARVDDGHRASLEYAKASSRASSASLAPPRREKRVEFGPDILAHRARIVVHDGYEIDAVRCRRHLFGDGVRCVETEVFEHAFQRRRGCRDVGTPHVLGAKYEKEFSWEDVEPLFEEHVVHALDQRVGVIEDGFKFWRIRLEPVGAS